MESVLAEVEFLARSQNRVEVLTALAEQRQTRRDLEAQTDASQATLGRILGDFQDRSWVRKDGSEYIATATGKLVRKPDHDSFKPPHRQLLYKYCDTSRLHSYASIFN